MYVLRVSFSQVKVAYIYFHSIIHITFTVVCYVRIRGNESPFVTKNVMYEAVNAFIVMYTVYKCVLSN